MFVPRGEGKGYLPWPGPRYFPPAPPSQVSMAGGGTARYLPTPAKIPTPGQVRTGGRGHPKVPTPLLGQLNGGFGYPMRVPIPSQGTYPPGQVRMGGGGTPRVPTPSQVYLPPSQVRMGGEGTPRYIPPPPPGQGLATQQAVNVSCIHVRRTFSFLMFLMEPISGHRSVEVGI